MAAPKTNKIHDFIGKNNLTSRRLLSALVREKLLPGNASITDLFQASNEGGYGLASDHVWYTAGQNDEVREAVESNQPTRLAAEALARH